MRRVVVPDGVRRKCSKCEKVGECRPRHAVCRSCQAADRTRRKRVAKTARPAPSVIVVTYAQNATPVHEGFWAALRSCVRSRRASLWVVGGRYHNPTSVWAQGDRAADWWADEVTPYLIDRRDFGPHLKVYGDISIQPTAERPLSGMEVFTGEASGVFGSPRVQLSTIASARRLPKILVTTGACTIPNYVASKAGKKAEAHHTLGALVIERATDGRFYLRQITAESDGSFDDLGWRYLPKGRRVRAERPAALICGDLHSDQVDERVLGATFDGKDSIVKMLRPRQIVYHDVLDFRIRNHHSISDFRKKIERLDETRTVEEEVRDASILIEHSTPEDSQGVVVASNHAEAFDRWLATADIRQDPANAGFFFAISTHVVADRWRTPAFEVAHKLAYPESSIRFLRRDEEYVIAGVQCGFHGDKGTNGARGTVGGYAKLGAPVTIGHHHTPTILDGCYVVGVTGKLDQGYNSLPSSWLHAHCLVYASGARTLLIVLPDGTWRREK